MNDRDLFVNYAMRWIGTWYRWGGDDPSGFDCSGLAVECLKAVGKISRGSDFTAWGLYRYFKDREMEVNLPRKGCLVFWYTSNNRRIIHVEICINPRQSIGASGGGSKTLTQEDAIRHNAYIKIRPINSRTGEKLYVDPFK